MSFYGYASVYDNNCRVLNQYNENESDGILPFSLGSTVLWNYRYHTRVVT